MNETRNDPAFRRAEQAKQNPEFSSMETPVDGQLL